MIEFDDNLFLTKIEAEEIERMEKRDLPPEVKRDLMHWRFLVILLRHMDIAERAYLCNDLPLLKAAGRTISADLEVLASYGFTYKGLISVCNADSDIKARIEANGETNNPLHELLVNYNIGLEHYKGTQAAIKAYMEGKKA